MKSYKQFITESKSKNSIELWHELWSRIDKKCKKYGIEVYKMNSDGTIDVYGDVYISNEKIKKLPLKFRDVSGSFLCSGNQLTTLEGSPKSVSGHFSCGNNQLTTLEGSPKSVGGDFYCYNNQLVDLRGFPEYYDGDVYYRDNPVSEILDLFARKVEGGKLGRIIDIINDYDVIQGNKVILDRLEEVYYQLDMTPPNNIKLTNYEIWE
jgi:hypothetical protein